MKQNIRYTGIISTILLILTHSPGSGQAPDVKTDPNLNQEKNKAPLNIQKMRAEFSAAMLQDAPTIDKFISYIWGLMYPVVVYSGALEEYFKNNQDMRAFCIMRSRKIYFKKDAFKEKDFYTIASLCHETAHSEQWLLALMRAFQGFFSKEACNSWTYWKEYDAEQKTINTLYKTQKYNELESYLKEKIKCLNFLISDEKKDYHPYVHGVVDAYVVLLEKNTGDKKLKKIFINAQFWNANWNTRKKLKNWKPKNWKERYKEYKKDFPETDAAGSKNASGRPA